MARTGALPVSLLKLNLEEGYDVVIITVQTHDAILDSNSKHLSGRRWEEVEKSVPSSLSSVKLEFHPQK